MNDLLGIFHKHIALMNEMITEEEKREEETEEGKEKA
jgi:hypothetical protein